MQRAIIGFHQDEFGDWVADLDCGHAQHVRHKPPFIERPWVATANGRAEKRGTRLTCALCAAEGLNMDTQIDHVVVTVPNLDAAAAQFEALGFTLTPRAQHPWGTANRLVQMAGQNFIEILELDRPHLLFEHDAAKTPPVFSFGAFNRDFLAAGLMGFSMLVLAGADSAADVARFVSAGLDTYAPFDFGRRAKLPDGREVDVAFSLAYATHPEITRAAFFTSHNKFPENFWKPEFQRHTNGAVVIEEAVLVAPEPRHLAHFIGGFTGQRPREIDGGLAAACGPQILSVLTPDVFAARFDGAMVDLAQGPRLAGLVIAASDPPARLTPASDAGGVTIAWSKRG